jgi:hypothetical protein
MLKEKIKKVLNYGKDKPVDLENKEYEKLINKPTWETMSPWKNDLRN